MFNRNTKGTNQKKVNEAKTVENIKYEPIQSLSSGFIYRDL